MTIDLAPAPDVAVETCGTCANGGKKRYGMIVCDLQRWTARQASTPCPIGRWEKLDQQLVARRAAQDGIENAVAAADRAVEGWSHIAFEFVHRFAEANRGRQYIGHEIVKASRAAGVVQPPNEKAWGSPIQRAARLKIIKRVGYAEDPNRHGNPVPLWETV